jgi:hypothetical protein
MTLTITSDLITSARTAHTARPIPGHTHAWHVTWFPGQLPGRSAAVTAMMLADVAARDPHSGRRICPHISNWAAEPGLTAPAAIALPSAPPGKITGRESAADPSGREAAGS